MSRVGPFFLDGTPDCFRLLGQGKFTNALTVTAALTREVKKLDDKQLLVEIFLIESQIHYELQHIPKVKQYSSFQPRCVGATFYLLLVRQRQQLFFCVLLFFFTGQSRFDSS